MPNTRKVIIDGTEFEVQIEGEGTTFSATVEGRTFEIQIPDAAPVIKKKRSAGGKKKKSGTVTSSIPGKIVTVEVKKGDEVTEGQVVLILVAMKMQNEVQAPVTGTVISVNISEGDAIEANIPLLVIEPAVTDEDCE